MTIDNGTAAHIGNLNSVTSLFATALENHEAGKTDLARTLYGEVLSREPDHTESLHLLGLITAWDGDAQTGTEMIRRAKMLSPGHAPHCNSLALTLRMMGRREEALAEFRVAVALRPGSGEIRNNLATTLRELGQHGPAITEYRLAAECAPGVAEIWYNLASTLAGQNSPGETETSFRRAIEINPRFANAIANYGRWLTAQGRWAEADKWLSEAVSLAPEDSLSWNNFGIVCQELGRVPDAEASYRKALSIDPSFADSHYNLGCLLFGEGRTDEAIACHRAAISTDRLHGAARIAVCMATLPILYRTDTEIASRRVQYRNELDALVGAAEATDIANAVASAIGTTQPFFLPYQGQNDRDPQSTYGRLACGLLQRNETRHEPARRPAPGERIRLGIVSGYFHDHTVFKLFLEGWLTQLDRERFEVIGCHTGRTHDSRTAHAETLCDRFVTGVRSGEEWSDIVANLQLNVLLYPEVGMDPISGRLAAQRLAPVQCVAWGHPETTGMPTVDHFLSSELMEPLDGDAHYTERLVRLPGLGLHYTPDNETIERLDRAASGIDPAGPLYWSGQALYKYSSCHDVVFPRIAAAVGPCQFVFIGFAKSASVTAMFRERLRQAFAAHDLDADRFCVMLPPMSQRRFMGAVALADVILDTPGWSGGRSTLDCLVIDPAIVTFPGPLMRGRHSAAILRRIGCESTIATSIDDYVSVAARLGLDAAWRARVRLAVAAGKHRAFRDTAPIRALEAFLTDAVAAACG